METITLEKVVKSIITITFDDSIKKYIVKKDDIKIMELTEEEKEHFLKLWIDKMDYTLV